MSSRDEFLKNWKAYPPMPAGARAYGRLKSVSATEVEIADVRIAHQSLDWNFLRPGDIVAVCGDQIVLLAPQLTSAPKQPTKKATLESWMQFQTQVRSFFQTKQFLEIQTPTLVKNPGTEPTLDVFSTEFEIQNRKEKYFLPTSPELHLKKALALGYERVFELRTCFRNGEISESHQPEFQMLEWYRAYSQFNVIKEDLKELVDLTSGKKQSYSSTSMAELFHRYLDFELKPNTTLAELLPLAKQVGYQVSKTDHFDDLFYGIFVAYIEPRLDSTDPLFVEKYPPSQAALARLTEDGWGDRFELYWKGLELCNAFHELNDPAEQRRRMLSDLAEKKRLGKADIPVDEDFLEHLAGGLPPSAGIALGLERLFMAIHDLKKIEEIKLFPMK